jgi:hypothetical protein
MRRRVSLLPACTALLAGVIAVGCAPVTWEVTSASAVTARTLVEEPARLDPSRDAIDVGVEARGDHTLVSVVHVVACSSEVKERVTLEKVSRAEPDPAFIVLDHVALIGGALAAALGVGFGAGCIGKSSSACDTTVPLIAGGLGIELFGAIALAADSGKRRTERVPHDEHRSFGFTTRECARSPVAGVEISLVPASGEGANGRTDEAGRADLVLGGARPVDVDVRIGGRTVRRQHLP